MSTQTLNAAEGSNPPAKNCFRLVILGSAKVGKTSIVSRFLNNKYEENYTPTIEDFHRKLYRIRGEVYQLDLLDTSGNHPFPAMRRLSFLTGDLFILVYSIDNPESYEEVKRLHDQILETKSSTLSKPGKDKVINIPMVIVGNKVDKENNRKVSAEDVANYVSKIQGSAAYVETSAKRNIKIDDIFYELFVLAKLPLEMSPALHRKVQPGYVGFQESSQGRRGLSIRRRLSDACGTVEPNARRPSIRTDLLILQAKAAEGNGRDERRDSKCIIQ